MMRDIYVFGDSIAYGQWDAEGGWVQRLRAEIDAAFIAGTGPKTLIYNMGIPGNTAADVLARMDGEMAPRFDAARDNLILFAVGMNDAHFSTSANAPRFTEAEFTDNIAALIAMARKYTPKVGFAGLNPVDQPRVDPLPWNTEKAYRQQRVEAFERLLRSQVLAEGLFFADIWREWIGLDYKKMLCDGLHPDAEGHRRIAAAVAPFLHHTA